MPLRCDEYNRVCVMGIDGDLSGDNAAALRKNAEERIDTKQVADFVVDLEHCSFIDSEGLEALLWLKRRCEDLFGQIKLIGLDDNCRKILEITRLEPRFECQRDLAAALKMM
ncbi:MAG: STAS domain-containing protein [Planctomycetota bacterium]|nr:STAS domain-containing protein [Planctomycetota bacterium]